jgi:hypothetical protein
MDFKDQYKHPLWQKKRLEAMECAGFCCESCESKDDQLHVHHRRYVKGRQIWEYDIKELSVLCGSCHEQAHADLEVFRQVQAMIPLSMMESASQLLAGWLDYFAFGDSSIEVSDQDAFYAGRLAGYFQEELGGMYSDMAVHVAPDVVKAFLNKESET